MNIILITNRYPQGPDDPAAPFVPDFVRALRKQGARVLVVTPLYGKVAEHDDPDVFRFAFGQTDSDAPIGSWSVSNPSTWVRIRDFLIAGQMAVDQALSHRAVDHILALWALPSGWFARRAARKWGVPYSVWCLGSDINVWAHRPVFRGITRKILGDAQHVFADGFRLANAARRLCGKAVRFLPSFRLLNIDLPDGSADPAHPCFLYAGRIHRQKGVFDLLEAFTLAGSALGGADLVFLGDGPDLPKLEAAARHRGIVDRVRLLGKADSKSLARYYRAARATVIPSYADSLPLVFSEAVQCGSPLIVYDTGDLGHFVGRFGLGQVVQCGDVTALSEALVRAASGKHNIAPGRAVVLELLHPQRAARRFLKAIGASKREQFAPVRTYTCEGEVPAG